MSVTGHGQGDPMLLDLERLRSDGERIERRYEASAYPGSETNEEFKVAAPIDLEFDIRKRDDEYRLEGRVCTALELACSRCVERFTLPVSSPFDLRYLPQSANTGDGDAEVESDDLTTAFYRDQTIDLGQLMREQFYLAVPMKPLCRESCRGLCAVCGTNLNENDCGCDTTWHDPRLEGLKALLENRRSE